MPSTGMITRLDAVGAMPSSVAVGRVMRGQVADGDVHVRGQEPEDDSDGLLRRSLAGNPGVMAAALPAGTRIRFKIFDGAGSGRARLQGSRRKHLGLRR